MFSNPPLIKTQSSVGAHLLLPSLFRSGPSCQEYSVIVYLTRGFRSSSQMANVTSDNIGPGLSATFNFQRGGIRQLYLRGRFSATVELPNMGPSRCGRITAVMNHAPFESQVTIIFTLDRSPRTKGDFSGGSRPGMGLPPVVYI